MEHCQMSNLLNNSTVSKFVTTERVEVNDVSGGQYSGNKNIWFETSMLKSDLCEYSDAYIVAKGSIDLLADAANENAKTEKDVAFKNNAPFRSCISKINNTLIDNPEDLDIVMPMYNLLQYSQHYSLTSGSLWNYYRDETDDVGDNASHGKSFIYKTKIVVNPPERPGNEGDANGPPVPTLNVEFTISLKYLSSFWKYFDLSAINCETELGLS